MRLCLDVSKPALLKGRFVLEWLGFFDAEGSAGVEDDFIAAFYFLFKQDCSEFVFDSSLDHAAERARAEFGIVSFSGKFGDGCIGNFKCDTLRFHLLLHAFDHELGNLPDVLLGEWLEYDDVIKAV